ncbi:MAG: hypothetical protein RBR69_09175 [Candidatus Cloacimonadaceae bacterium]|jgi:hypothetical protein|nr:hypothetical protein [Candidatus Cloacimonadota bacterium]MDY0128286.1 hypothetical protein [Candidatus Cloacimonadaceae bacterium]MCB5254395.1 hypothetical protein [Candidatus Cloacimonadota bacterium]MCK9178890.1 hypothetical protein [Candidatus Cloacimonadota bacterium]MCK9243293.1 hypothetical protein [Candidatus Cloacimonadota bacterium]
MKNITILLLLSLAILPLMAQHNIPRPDFNPFSLSNPALKNLSMSHSMGFEAGTSSRGDGYYLSRYTNHLNYAISPKLDLELDLNFVNFGSMNTSQSFSMNDDNDSKILPEFSLRYRPSDSMTFELKMSQGMIRPVRPWHENR